MLRSRSKRKWSIWLLRKPKSNSVSWTQKSVRLLMPSCISARKKQKHASMKLNELLKEKEAVQAELDELYGKWEKLSEEAEG